MIELESHLRLTRAAVESSNLTDEFSSDDLAAIGRVVHEGYSIDRESRAPWERRTEAAIDLALQVVKAKSFPWPNSSNVKFPLVTIAALQWHSRAYPLLLQGNEVVKMRVNFPDPDGHYRQSADRISKYMSYQLLEEMPSWEEETDRALLQIPIVGCAFKKTYRSAQRSRNESELVAAKDLYLPYMAPSVEEAQRRTHRIPLYRHEVYERCAFGSWRDVRNETWFEKPTPVNLPGTPESDSRRDKRTGIMPAAVADIASPIYFLEQHTRLDLDGDGYPEPYIITIEESSRCVCRIVANFDWEDILFDGKKVIRINETQYFTKLPFVRSPDGSIYDIGFGAFLGPLNESVNSIINQLIDAGTLATTAGGFLGRGVKMKGGETSFSPFQWNRIDSTGEDLHKGVMPLPVREPSTVLFQLLGLLIDYTNRISGSTDIMVGENPGQNTPAETSRLMAEQGAKINAAIFKRVWRGFRSEFQKLYALNRKFVPATVLRYGEKSQWISRQDFALPPDSLSPAADPNLSSDTQRVQQALLLTQRAQSVGGYNKDEVERRLLSALKIESPESLFPGSEKMPAPPHPKVALEQLKLQGKAEDRKSKLLEKIIAIESEREKTVAEIDLIRAQIAAIVSEIGEAQAAHQVKAFEAQVSALQAVDNSQRGYMELLMQLVSPQGAQQGSKQNVPNRPQPGAVPGMAQPSGDAAGLLGP